MDNGSDLICQINPGTGDRNERKHALKKTIYYQLQPSIYRTDHSEYFFNMPERNISHRFHLYRKHHR